MYTHITTQNQSNQMIMTAGDHVFFFHNLSFDLNVEIAHPHARVYIFGLFTGKAKQIYHLRTHQHHTVPGGYSELMVKGVLDDQSSMDYSGYIKIEKDCNGSHAYQKNQTLLLSSRARVSSEPNLEILSPDVFCTHGSTTGHINADQLYYMQTKGLSRPAAKLLYIDGFINDLVDKIKGKAPTFQFHHH